MKRSLITKGLIAILIVFIFGLSAVGCKFFDKTPDTNDGNGDEVVSVDKSALNAEIALEVTEQGDYTVDSYNAYIEKLEEAKKIAEADTADQAIVDQVTAELSAARLALVTKPVYEVEGGKKSFVLIQGDSQEISLADYVDINGLSKISYKVKTSNAVVSLSPITDGKFTMTAGAVKEATDATVSIIVYYDNIEKLKVDLTVKISNEVAPVLVSEEIVKEYDMLALSGKESIVIDFAENIINSGNLELAYSVKQDGEEITLNGSEYTVTLGSYTVEYAYVTFNVTVSCEVNGEIRTLEYTYKLGIKDTRRYSVVNGSFENGLDGWTLINTQGEAPFGGIDEKTHFWPENQNFPMNNIGK